MVVIALGTSLLISTGQRKQYTASASYQFQAPESALSLVAVGTISALTPAQLASQAAQSTTQPVVLDLVRRALGNRYTDARLTSAITASVNPNSSNVDVTGTAATPNDAAAIANAVARSSVRVANRTQQAQFAADARAVEKQRVPGHDPGATAVKAQSVVRLQQLAAIARPAQVINVATPPGAPSSPKTARNAAIAGFLGLLVALLIIYLWDSQDRRLRTVEEISREINFPLVGRVRKQSLGLGSKPDSDWREVEPIDWEQFRILYRNIEFLGSNGAPPRVIAVTSSAPQEGKTTVATFVSLAAAAAGKQAILVECDLRRPVLAQRLRLARGPGVTDFVSDTAGPRDVLQTVSLAGIAGTDRPDANTNGRTQTPAGRLVCVTAGTHSDYPAETLESDKFREMISELSAVYDVVILDTPPLLPVVDTLAVIDSIDAVVFCAREATLTRGQAKAGMQALERAHVQSVGLVVTGVTTRMDRSYESYYNYLPENDRAQSAAGKSAFSRLRRV